jgi:hypothetical protein
MKTTTNLSNSDMNTEFIRVHEMCKSISESKRYNQILRQPIPDGECSLRNVFRTGLDLMITRTKIDLGKDLNTDTLVKKNVDAGKGYLFLIVKDRRR